MKMSRACPGMLSSENDDFEFLKTAKNIKMHVLYSSRAHVTVLSLQTSFSLTKKRNITVAKELNYIFSEISKF